MDLTLSIKERVILEVERLDIIENTKAGSNYVFKDLFKARLKKTLEEKKLKSYALRLAQNKLTLKEHLR